MMCTYTRLSVYLVSPCRSPSLLTSCPQVLREMELRDTMTLFSTVTKRCFDLCVQDSTSNHLTEKEKNCAKNCSLKSVAAQVRANTNFASGYLQQGQDGK
eukprot:TRINITY_DN701_c0_g1_i2.p1 TRINITY_DN701_c0_g1~~TRINITY_DN701_c0_g1_i2.p1  ORF type:complete len:100 (-),score=25.75 TRINITY_DN701_c0_g1_i2:16-315(-)